MGLSEEFMRVRRGGIGSQSITGLEWGGNEASNTQRVLAFNGSGGSPSPFAFVDTAAGGATYIFKVYPKGPKNGGASFPNYWTTFFWGNYGTFNSAKNYIGAHPYPFDGNDVSTAQNWELSLVADDFAEADITANHNAPTGVWGAGGPPSETNGSAAVTWNRWYTQVVRVFRVDANTVRHQFFFDYDLFISSSGASGWFQHTVSDASWGDVANDPTTPSIVIGEAPPNDGNTASWGGYQGREQFKGIIRGMQLYDACLGVQVLEPTVANMADVTSEITTPGSIRTPWWKKINPVSVDDLTDNGRTPWYPSGSKPTLWTGT